MPERRGASVGQPQADFQRQLKEKIFQPFPRRRAARRDSGAAHRADRMAAKIVSDPRSVPGTSRVAGIGGPPRIQGSIIKRFTNGNPFNTTKRRPKRRGRAWMPDITSMSGRHGQF